ncbi:MAG: hypothetical protein ABI565_03425 [Vicinamibacteria bacterium]
MVDEILRLIDGFTVLGGRVVSFIPRLLVAVLALIIGWLVARLFRNLTRRLLRFARIDAAAERVGIDDYLVRGGVRSTTVTLVADAVYWVITLCALLAVLSIMGVDTASRLLDRLSVAVPNGIAVLLFVVIGSLLGQFVGAITYSYLSNIGVSGARAISVITRYAITVFVVSVGLEQLSIGGQVLVSAFQMAFGALCLALALAFGLGGREWAARVLDSWWKN